MSIQYKCFDVKFPVTAWSLMKGFCCVFFYTMNSMLGLGKEVQIWHYIQYSMYTHISVL